MDRQHQAGSDGLWRNGSRVTATIKSWRVSERGGPKRLSNEDTPAPEAGDYQSVIRLESAQRGIVYKPRTSSAGVFGEAMQLNMLEN